MRIEIRKEHDHRGEEQQVQRLTWAEIGQNRRHHRTGRTTREGRDRRRQQQQRRGKNRRNNACGVHFDRQVAGAPVIDLHAHLTARILDVDLAQGALHEHHKGDQSSHQQDDPDDHNRRNRARTALAKELGQSGGNLGDDADKDDQRDTVTNAACGDLLTQPHQEHGAPDQRDHSRRDKEHTRVRHQITGLQADGKAIGLERRQQNRAIARVLVDLFAALFALFLHLLKRRNQRGQQLNDNRGRDVGHDAQRKNPHTAKRTAGEHRKDAPQTCGCTFHKVAQRVAVDPGNRNEGAKAINDQKAKGEKNPLTQLGRLTKGAPAHVRGHLLCCRCHYSLFHDSAAETVSRFGGA